MTIQTSIGITKSDFLTYCEAPRHLWAKKHGIIARQISEFSQHLIDDGEMVESLAREYLFNGLLSEYPDFQIVWQQTFFDGPFSIRVDALVHKNRSKSYDLYEIKSSTGVDKDIVRDVTFQAVILDQQIIVDNYYVLHLNRVYHRIGEVDLSSLFIAEDISEKVSAMKAEITELREKALDVAQLENCGDTEICFSPKNCPCPEICHPGLPDFSIFDIPFLGRNKKLQLLENGIKAAQDIPISFSLNEKQRLIADCARNHKEHINKEALQSILDKIQFPLWFLDYETCISAIPLYDNYHPQQQVVFQYSLHKLDQPDGDLFHFCHISITPFDPSLEMLEHLTKDLNSSGTIIVWNKTFEMTRNSEMAILHPGFASFLEDVNARIFDLGDVVNLGYYLHPGFKGSWSIKNVLPVMVPELTYEGLAINQGDQASMAWWKMTFNNISDQEKDHLIECLDKYCELDTLAMVEIYKKIRNINK